MQKTKSDEKPSQSIQVTSSSAQPILPHWGFLGDANKMVTTNLYVIAERDSQKKLLYIFFGFVMLKFLEISDIVNIYFVWFCLIGPWTLRSSYG